MKVSYFVGSTDEQGTNTLILLASYSKFWRDNEVNLKLSKGEPGTQVEQWMEIIGEYDKVKHIAEDLFDEKDFDNMYEEVK